MKKKVRLTLIVALFFIQCSFANIFYVSTNGNDGTGDGSASNPWRTIKYAVNKVPANQGHTIRISAGTFVEEGQIKVPPGVNIMGAGKDLTIIRAASSFYYNPVSPGYAVEKFLFSLRAQAPSDGNQSLAHFTIDGDSKQLHGGIYVRYRNGVVIDAVHVRNTHFNGIWLLDVKNSRISNTELLNCSWGSTNYCAGALHLGNIETVEITNVDINENVGYGIKAIGPAVENRISNLKIHNSRVSVRPEGLWNNGSAPNIAIELFVDHLSGCEIYDSYVDNTISVVTTNPAPATGIQTIRIHHNIIDMESRAQGSGYGVELTMHDAEIDHNYFIKGSYGIANWHTRRQNWNIHHNTFYALGGAYPGDVLRAQLNGLHSVNFYNNTIEFSGEKTMNVIGLYGGTSENVNVINNLLINNNSAYSFYPNTLVHLENNAAVTGLVVKNNFFDRLPLGNVTGAYSDNLEGDPKIYKSGNRPDPFYQPTPKSPLRAAGSQDTSSFPALTPDIGALEYDEKLFNQPPQVRITDPADNSSSYSGSVITIKAEASDSLGTVTNVEFFNGGTKFAEDSSSPYTGKTAELTEGTYAITAIATDNYGATDTSAVVTVSVLPWIRLSLYAPDTKRWGYMSLTNDTTASKGNYFSIPSGYGSNYSLGASAAQWDFELEKTDDYVMWIRVRSPGEDNQGYYIYDGKGNWTTWLAGIHVDWTWVKASDVYKNATATFPFTAGSNVLVFSWLHENVHVDQVIITNNPDFIPTMKDGTASARTSASALPIFAEAVKAETSRGLHLYPNPVKNDFTITYRSPVLQNAEIRITTLTSIVVKQTSLQLNEGPNVIKLNSDNLSNGIYFVSLVTATGESFRIKTVISK